MEIEEHGFSSGFDIFIEINRAFEFLKNEEYKTVRFFIGREVSIVYNNKKLKQSILITLLEPDANNTWKWQIMIEKRCILSKTLSVTDFIDLPKNESIINQLISYSTFMRKYLMPIVRGERWSQINKCQINEPLDIFTPYDNMFDLSQEEIMFRDLYFSLGFLFMEGYHGTIFNIGNIVSLTVSNHILKQSVSFSIASYSCEWNVSIEKGKCNPLKKISVNELLCKYGQTGYTYSLNTCTDFIQQHLMPVIRGEKWL